MDISKQYLMWFSYFNIILLIIIPTKLLGQSTLSKTGCTFADQNVVYNVHLLDHKSYNECPTEEWIQQIEQVQNDKLRKTQESLQNLKSLASQLQQRNKKHLRVLDKMKGKLEDLKEQLRKNPRTTTCLPGYDLRNDTFRSCYMFVGRYHSWYDAEKYCMATGGHLLALETEEEQDFLVTYIEAHNLLPGHHLWIGGNDIGKEDVWVWAGINQEFNYTQWLQYPHYNGGVVEMPDNYAKVEHCVHLFYLHQYDWNDLYCHNEHYFVCEQKIL